MNLLHDITLSDGTEIKGCYFIKYQKPIRIGIGNAIVAYFDDCIKCYDSKNNEILGKNFFESVINKIYDEDSMIDWTDFYANMYVEMCELSNERINFPFIRKVVRLD